MLLQRSISHEPNIEGENGLEIPLAVNDSFNEQAPQDSESEFEGENEIPVAVEDSLHEQAPQEPESEVEGENELMIPLALGDAQY